jgi:hypothetical protein
MRQFGCRKGRQFEFPDGLPQQCPALVKRAVVRLGGGVPLVNFIHHGRATPWLTSARNGSNVARFWGGSQINDYERAT